MDHAFQIVVVLPNKKKGKLISINCLEFACVVINFAAAIYACHVDDIDLSNYPVLLNWCANKAATCWVNVRCKSSMIGRNLAKISIGLLMGTNLSIHAEGLSTKLNVIADDISRLEDADGNYDYSQLIVDHPS